MLYGVFPLRCRCELKAGVLDSSLVRSTREGRYSTSGHLEQAQKAVKCTVICEEITIWAHYDHFTISRRAKTGHIRRRPCCGIANRSRAPGRRLKPTLTWVGVKKMYTFGDDVSMTTASELARFMGHYCDKVDPMMLTKEPDRYLITV